MLMDSQKAQTEANSRLKKAMNEDCIEVNKQQECYRRILKTDPHKIL